MPTFFYSTSGPSPIPLKLTTVQLGSDLDGTNEKLLRETWKAEGKERLLGVMMGGGTLAASMHRRLDTASCM